MPSKSANSHFVADICADGEMPFMQLNFSTYEAAIALQTRLIEQLSRLSRPSNVLGAVIQARCRRRPDHRTPAQKIFLVVNWTTLVILSFLFTVSLVLEVSQVRTSSHLCLRIILIIVRIEATFAFVCVFIWFWNEGNIKIREDILKSTNGVGIVKKSAILHGQNKIAIIYGFLRVAFYASAYGLFQFHHRHPLLNFQLSVDPNLLNVIFLSIVIIQFAAFPILFSIFTYVLLCLIAEFEGLSEDFEGDENTYQLPVIRHYLFAHAQILYVFHKFRTYFAQVGNGFVLCAICTLIAALHPSFNDIIVEWKTTTIIIIAVIDHCLVKNLIFGFGAAVNESVVSFSEPTLRIVAANRVLHEEVASTILGYHTFLKTSRKSRLLLFELCPYKRQYCFILMVFLIFAALWKLPSIT
uniref:Odorant receptor n=1 Tax=Panagrellus redivivus TaxID=6233 RepID=A0A7E4VTC5_PANRE